MYKEDKELLKSIKLMTVPELNALSEEIKTDMIDTVSRTGGHLASSLGAVELTVAIYHVFDIPKDKVFWDVGHQCYASKMISGRWDRMESLRQLGGLSGFPKRSESPADLSDPGHSGTSISIAQGSAVARDLAGENYSCVAVIGDGSMTSGVAWEALDMIGDKKTPVIVILNDNTMSISENVGGFSKHLQKLRTSDFYNRFKKRLKNKNTPKGIHRLGSIRNAIKYSVLPRTIFDEIGFKYYGPIDGHDMESLINMLSFIKTLKEPVVLHVLTKKGNGFAPAENDPTKFHGIGRYDPKSGETAESSAKSWSEIFGECMVRLSEKDDRLCAITAAMGDSTGLCGFAQKHPERFFDVGIAEQHAAALSEGLALSGLRPVVAIYSTFLQRAYDQVLTEVCLQKLPVIFAVDRAGITGHDGETHQGIYDIAYLSSMPGMTVMCPRDEATLFNMMNVALRLGTPVAVRYPKGRPLSFDIPAGNGAPQMLKNGKDMIILSDANSLKDALGAAEIFDKSIISGWKPMSCAVCDIGTLRPFDEEFVKDCFGRYSMVITLEDGIVSGGFGSAVSSLACASGAECRVLNLGWPDAFIEHGSIEELRKKYRLDSEGIVERIRSFAGGMS
ncbi:MAG: 1-deoxy-D-xylulose-5-phosphate synthase [Firmicutes bacterium]|nr:1-deoxy-D-xylulose-5-phosphate synthase [Bacillota bacterium]